MRLPVLLLSRAAALLLLIMFSASPVHAVPRGNTVHDVSVLYIESNTGDSSGGHAALRTGQEVFHFQHGENGLLLLHRERWDEFRFYYNDLGNRTVYEARLELQPEASERIRRYFTSMLIEQDVRLARLDGMRKDVELLVAIEAGNSSLAIRGAGLFLRKDNSGGKASINLKQKISRKLGGSFLRDLCHELFIKLSHLPQNYNQHAPDLAAYREQLSLFEAVSILEKCRGINPAALIRIPPRAGNHESCHLSPKERQALKRWEDFFLYSITALLQSRRPDRGFPLMLATARFLAIRESLRQGTLLVLSTFPADADTADAVYGAGSMKMLRKMALSAGKNLEDERGRLLSQTETDEALWSRFENLASRYAELSDCAQGKQKMRLYAGISVPSLPATIPCPLQLPAEEVSETLKNAKKRLKNFQKQMHLDMRYNLFTRNCVTEIFTGISHALSQAQGKDTASPSLLSAEQKAVLESISFIPWKMFQQVTAGMDTSEIIRYPSWRDRRLEALYQKDNPVTVYARECNTITSSIYRNGRQDSAFLFFTQDSVLARPLFGTLNIAWTLPHMCIGLITWPIDSGYLIKSGAMGTLFSIPELFFVNIRKGNFAYIPQEGK